MLVSIQFFGGRGSGGSSASRGGGGGGAQVPSPQQKSLTDRAKDGDLTTTDFNKMDIGSRAALLNRTPIGTVVTAASGTQYTHTGDNRWARSGKEIFLGRSAPRTAVNSSYVSHQTANGRMRSIRYK